MISNKDEYDLRFDLRAGTKSTRGDTFDFFTTLRKDVLRLVDSMFLFIPMQSPMYSYSLRVTNGTGYCSRQWGQLRSARVPCTLCMCMVI